MRISILFLALLIPGVLQAETPIYESTEHNGSVLFSDVPSANSHLVTLNDNTVSTRSSDPTGAPAASAPESTMQSASGADTATAPYTIKILEPTDQETIQNESHITVTVDIQPRLRNGDKVQLMLDGQDVGKPQDETTFTLNNVARGTHILQVVIINAQGQHAQVNKSITFFVHQPSTLLLKDR